MKRVYKAPKEIPFKPNTYNVFLAGSIEMGKAVDWQTELTDMILAKPKLKRLIITNPRRDDWDSSWVQSIDNKQFNKQVTWELDNIEEANFVVFVFDKDTTSPITLLELGKVSEMDQASDSVVLCPEGYFRKGNVDIVCERSNITQVNDLNGIIEFLVKRMAIYDLIDGEREAYDDYMDGEK